MTATRKAFNLVRITNACLITICSGQLPLEGVIFAGTFADIADAVGYIGAHTESQRQNEWNESVLSDHHFSAF